MYIPTTVPLCPLISFPHLLPCHPSIHSSERVRSPLGSQKSLAYYVEAGSVYWPQTVPGVGSPLLNGL